MLSGYGFHVAKFRYKLLTYSSDPDRYPLQSMHFFKNFRLPLV